MSAIDARFDLPLLIEGKEVRTPDVLEVRYPYTGEVIGSVPKLTRDEVWGLLDRMSGRSFTLTAMSARPSSTASPTASRRTPATSRG